MPVPNPKNYWTGAAADLNVGDQMQQMLTDAEEERRKKLLKQALDSKTPGGYGDMALNPGAMELFGRGSMGMGQR